MPVYYSVTVDFLHAACMGCIDLAAGNFLKWTLVPKRTVHCRENSRAGQDGIVPINSLLTVTIVATHHHQLAVGCQEAQGEIRVTVKSPHSDTLQSHPDWHHECAVHQNHPEMSGCNGNSAELA